MPQLSHSLENPVLSEQNAETTADEPTEGSSAAPTEEQQQFDRELRAQVQLAIEAAEDRKAENTQAFFVGEVMGITDWFVVTSASNTRQVRAIVDNIEEELTELLGVKPIAVEGLDSLDWVLMDFGGFVVHVFHHELRSYYNLERLWSDVPRFEPVSA